LILSHAFDSPDLYGASSFFETILPGRGCFNIFPAIAAGHDITAAAIVAGLSEASRLSWRERRFSHEIVNRRLCDFFTADIQPCPNNVRFSNRPVWVKRFQTIHRASVDVARGLVLLFGIGAKALPSWDSRTLAHQLETTLI
jgi:hypothetical protein